MLSGRLPWLLFLLMLVLRNVAVNPCFVHCYETQQNIVLIAFEQPETLLQSSSKSQPLRNIIGFHDFIRLWSVTGKPHKYFYNWSVCTDLNWAFEAFRVTLALCDHNKIQWTTFLSLKIILRSVHKISQFYSWFEWCYSAKKIAPSPVS